eukprot:1880226-Pleurochrysis_carterae.AAC.1
MNASDFEDDDVGGDSADNDAVGFVESVVLHKPARPLRCHRQQPVQPAYTARGDAAPVPAHAPLPAS